MIGVIYVNNKIYICIILFIVIVGIIYFTFQKSNTIQENSNYNNLNTTLENENIETDHITEFNEL